WNSADRFPPFHALSLLKKAASTTETFLKACIPLIGLRWASSKRYPAARDWLERYQPPDVVKRLWDPLTISALNESPDRLGLKAFKKWIFTGLTDYRSATDLKIPSLSLRSLYGDKLGEGLQRRGVDIQKHTRIKQIDPTQPSITIDGGETRSPDWVISALEDRVLWARLIEQARERDPFNRIPDWDHAPIVSVHLLYEKPLDVPPFALLPETPFEWMFALRQPEEYGYVQCVKSAAREASGREKEDLVREATESVSPLIPNENERINSRVVKEKNATLSMTAETTKQRFGPETPYENFLVAGDWTDCGWPPTMESAVRSGYRAAQKVDSDCPGPKPDPRPEGLLSLFSPVEM
ncbi:MAG: FAD-dependent oxidoreductase, partial [bacterium]